MLNEVFGKGLLSGAGNRVTFIFVFLAVLLFSLVSAYMIPSYAYRYVCWKQLKKGKAAPENFKRKLWMILSFVFSLIGMSLAVFFLPLWKVFFFAMFLLFSVFGVIVDSCIRIIGNEMLLSLLPVVLLYRFLDSSGPVAALLGSLLAVLVILAFFLLAHLIVYLHKGVRGVGMGDVKLCILIAFALGIQGIVDFALGLAVAIFAYLAWRIIRTPIFLHYIFDTDNTFPMCGPIVCGFLYALLVGYGVDYGSLFRMLLG